MEMTSGYLKQFVNEFGVFSNHSQMLKLKDTKIGYDLVFSKIESIHERINAINQRTSYLFNYLNFFDINENKMSEMLSYLLNPKETHGHGDAYLKVFCSGIEAIKKFSDANVETEHCTDTYRRIDILVRVDGHWLIIENKYRDAVDQESQLNDYYMYAKRRLGEANAGKIYIFYLTNNHREPPESTLEKRWKEELQGKLICKSFSDEICIFLHRCREISKTLKMQVFIDDLIDYIKGVEKMGEHEEEIFKWLSEEEKRTRYAREISDIYNDYMWYLIRHFVQQLQFDLSIQVKQKLGENWLVKQDPDIYNANKAFRVSKLDWKDKYFVGLSNEWNNFNGIYYGLYGWHKTLLEKEKELQTKITEKFGQSRTVSEGGDDYIWWNHISECHDLWGPIDNQCKLLERNRSLLIESWINQLIALARFIDEQTNVTELANSLG